MITERHMKPGSWTVPLSGVLSDHVLDPIAFFGSVVVTPQPVDVALFTDAQILDAAIFSGMVRRIPRGDNINLSGVGNLAWFGDESGRGDIIETAYVPGTTTFAGWVNGLSGTINSVPSPITVGTVAAVAAPGSGELTETYTEVTRRNILDIVAAYYGGEFRITPDFTIDAGAESDLFTTTPVTAITRHKSATDPALSVISASGFSVEVDVDEFAAKVHVRGSSGSILASATTTSPYLDPQGAALVRDVIVDYETSSATVASEIAINEVASRAVVRRMIRVTSNEFNPKGPVKVGDTVWVFDDTSGIFDLANPVPFRGETIFPEKVRVLGIKWPLKRGLGVYYRAGDGTYTDLTPHVAWESGAATLEVGATLRSIFA